MSRIGKLKITHLWLLYFASDFLAITTSYYVIYWMRFYSEWGQTFFTLINRITGMNTNTYMGGTLQSFYITSAPRIILLLTITLTLLYAIRHLYSGRRFIRPYPVAWNILLANGIALAIFYTYFYMTRNVFHPRSFFVTVLTCNACLCPVFRGILNICLERLRSRTGIDRWSTMIVGSLQETEIISNIIEWLHPHGLHITRKMEFDPNKPFAETINQIESEIKNHAIDILIIADQRLSLSRIMELLEATGRLCIPVKVLSDKMNVLKDHVKNTVDVIHGVAFAHFNAAKTNDRLESVRLFFSKITALVLFVIFLPIMAIIALLIRLTSAGPALFTQERIGINRKPFKMHKFRTMYHKADEIQAQVEEFNDSEGALFKIKKDPRVTAVGRFLRRYSLDELPQLFNVIKGDMMLIGPRPLPRRDFENYYEEWHYSRHSGMPGLTCLWQISGRSDLDFHQMCILDVFYLRNRNWMLDLRIALETIWVVLFAKGAY